MRFSACAVEWLGEVGVPPPTKLAPISVLVGGISNDTVPGVLVLDVVRALFAVGADADDVREPHLEHKRPLLAPAELVRG